MLLDQILFHAPGPIFWKDTEGRFLGCNRFFLEKIANFIDYSELIGKQMMNYRGENVLKPMLRRIDMS